jgi:hypothetical protein
MRTILRPLCLALALAPCAAYADTLMIEKVQADRETASERPSRGMSKETVLGRFGQPETWTEAVGEPPISRWIYPSYTVYFERDRVLHAVSRR